MINYQFPLYLALEEARNLLFKSAKGFKTQKNEKNAIAFKVIKSSGKSFGAVVGKESKSYEVFRNTLEERFGQDAENNIGEYLRDIHIRLLRDKAVLSQIKQGEKHKYEERLKNYFYNNFNEDVHKEEQIKNYIEDIENFIKEIYINAEEEKMENDKCSELKSNKEFKQIYSYLRFIRFMDEKSELFFIDKKEGENND